MYYSPLRYPGGKGKLAPFMELMIDKLGIRGGTYIEPFAGGAGIALELLFKDTVTQVVLNDYDKAIAAFWNAILKSPNQFIDKMYEAPVTIDEWLKQKKIYQNGKSSHDFELGFATFFLNRTNRSGIIKGGIIGGFEQEGEWEINARFNKPELERRIRRIAERRNDIKVYNKDVNKFITKILPNYADNTFVYFDPPYFNKGKKLYKNFFEYRHHVQIERYISEYVTCNWMITYDDAEQISNIYDGYTIRRFDLNYSAARKRVASEIMIFPNEKICPLLNELKERKICINFR